MWQNQENLVNNNTGGRVVQDDSQFSLPSTDLALTELGLQGGVVSLLNDLMVFGHPHLFFQFIVLPYYISHKT